jgi:hypothetical protein
VQDVQIREDSCMRQQPLQVRCTYCTRISLPEHRAARLYITKKAAGRHTDRQVAFNCGITQGCA